MQSRIHQIIVLILLVTLAALAVLSVGLPDPMVQAWIFLTFFGLLSRAGDRLPQAR